MSPSLSLFSPTRMAALMSDSMENKKADGSTEAIAGVAPEGESEQPERLRGLKRLVITSSLWSMVNYGGSQFFRLVGNLILARLLFPEAFGLMALINVFMQGLQMFSDIGIGPSIVQSKRGDDVTFVRTAWTVQIIRGFGLFVFSCLMAWPLSVFYAQPQILMLFPVVGFNSALSGVNTTAFFTLNRQLNLGRITILDFFNQLLGIGVMILFAWTIPSVWALVVGGLAGTISRTILGYVFLPGISHRLAWEPEARAELVRFGRWIFISTAFTFLASQGDRLILGYLLTMTELGIYSIAFALSQTFVMAFQTLANTVLFPLYSRLTTDDPYWALVKMRRLRSVLLGGAVVPSCLLILFSKPIIKLLYDTRYQDAGWMLGLLAIAAIPTIVNLSLNPMLLARGDSFRMMIYNLIKSVLMLAFMLLGGYLAGVKGLIQGYVVSQFAEYVLLITFIRRYGVWMPSIDLAFFGLCSAILAGVKVSVGW